MQQQTHAGSLHHQTSFTRVASCCLFLVGNLKGEGSVATQEVEIDGSFKALGIGRNVLVLELDSALAALVVPGANVVVVDTEVQHHVVEGIDVEGKRLVPDGVDLALLGRGDLGSKVPVAELRGMGDQKRNKKKN